ncbi:MAG: MSCRAMM family adhesin SdrC, partial [Verrucomicrobiales bacterium]|nr:MSCRAMM family adhesin SdrC [Verrucomicrobiales bacterium]
LAVSPFDADGTRVNERTPAGQLVLYAGTGSFSSAHNGGPAAGLFRSRDGGVTWQEVGQFDGLRITVIAPSMGTNGVVFVGTYELTTSGINRGGLYRTADGGGAWDRLSGEADLPEWRVTDVIEDPGDPGRFYVALAGEERLENDDELDPAEKGIYRTNNGDADDADDITWSRIVDGITPDYDHDGVPNELDLSEDVDGDTHITLGEDRDGDRRLDVANEDTNANGILDAGEDRDADGNLDVDEDGDHDGMLDEDEDLNDNGRLDQYGVAETLENALRIRLAVSEAASNPIYAAIIGAHDKRLAGVFRSENQGDRWTPLDLLHTPRTNGGQGDLHFAIVADPTDADTVYVAGDASLETPGAGIAFRWDAGQAWVPIVAPTTTRAAPSTGVTTAPHADFRDLVFTNDSNSILAATDGGIYRLKDPRGDLDSNPDPNLDSDPTGWEFIGGGLRITEIGHSVAYDRNTDSVFAGTQDNGVIQQTGPDSTDWNALSGGDGNFVGVAYDAALSLRYFMANNFFTFELRQFTRAGDEVNPVLHPITRVSSVGGPGTLVRITSLNHGLNNGDEVQISGVLGVPEANVFATVQGVTPDTFDLAGTSFGANSEYLGEGAWQRFGRITQVAGVAGAPISITSATDHGLRDGELVTVQGLAGNLSAMWNTFAITSTGPTTFTLNGTSADGSTTTQGLWTRSNTVALKNAPGASDLGGLDNTVTLPNSASDQTFTGFDPIPFAVNAVESDRLILGRTRLYRSHDRGLTIAPFGSATPTAFVTALAYGGREGEVPVPDVIYVARGRSLYMSSDDGGSFKGGRPEGASTITHLALDPNNWRTAFAVDQAHVWLVTVAGDGSVAFKDATGNLGDLTSQFESVEIVSRDGRLVVAVGAQDGVYRMAISDLDAFKEAERPRAIWTRFGAALPNVLVTDLQFDERDPANPNDDVLVAGTLGRGVWLMRDATDALFADPALRVETGGGNQNVRLRLEVRSAAQPPSLEVLIDGDVVARHPLTNLRKIFVHTGDGNDTLTIDSSNGEVVVPDGVAFDGGADADELDFEGPTNDGLSTDSEDGVEIRQMGQQIVRATNVEEFANQSAWENFLEAIGNGFDAVARFFRNIYQFLDQNLDAPPLGNSLGSGLNGGDFGQFSPVNDPIFGRGGATEAPPPFGQARSESTSVLARLFESGGLRLSDIGTVITEPGALQRTLDSLDSIDNNVTVTANADTTTGSIIFGDPRDWENKPFKSTLAFNIPLELELLDGAITLSGQLELAADIELRLEIGVDERGFYLATNTQPEVSIKNIHVTGDVTGFANFGMLQVKLTEATLALDPALGIQIDLLEPDDPYGRAPDNKLRLYEFGSDLTGFFDVEFAGGSAEPDITLRGTFEVAAMEPGGDPILNLPPITLGFIWDDISDVTNVRIDLSGNPLADLLMRFVNFDAKSLMAELRGLLSSFTQFGGTDLLDVELPFSNGFKLSKAFDFSEAFLNKVYRQLVDVNLAGSTSRDSDDIAQGRLSGDSSFRLVIDDVTSDPITVTTAATSTNTSLGDLAADINAALPASVAAKVRAEPFQGNIRFVLLAGASLKVTADNPSDPLFSDLGFTNNQGGLELPKFPNLQSLFARLQELLSAELNLSYDQATKRLTFNVQFPYEFVSESTSYDTNIGLGDLAAISFSGHLEVTASVIFNFNLGIEFNAVNVPKLVTSLVVPPPSSGRLSGASTFKINLNDGSRSTFTLSADATSGNGSLDELVTDLNTLLADPEQSYSGNRLDKVVRFIRSVNAITLVALNEADVENVGVLDASEDTNGDNERQLWLDQINSITIEADPADPIYTEVGFTPSNMARSLIKGVFLENTSLTGNLTVEAQDLAASARFAIFGIESSDIDLTSSASV